MHGCNHIRRLIEEADQPEVFPLEVTGHIAHCGGCRDFATERSALRQLVASSGRVSAPVNFDAMLNARLAEAKGQRTLSWLNPAAFMRMGAAAAGLVIALLVIQYTGVLSPADQPNSSQAVIPTPPATPDSRLQTLPLPLPPVIESQPEPQVRASVISRATTAVPVKRAGSVSAQPGRSPDYAGIEDGGIILVRGQNGEREVPLPTVSVGAQPLLYINSSRTASRSAGTSF